MDTPFASPQVRMGESIVRRLANATGQLPLGHQFIGVFSRRAGQAAVGVGMLAREVTLLCISADLAEPVRRGTALQVEHLGASTAWLVAEVIPNIERGQTLLALEEA